MYHRKLRTIVGNTVTGNVVNGVRQTARDLFDLYVLSIHHMPLLDFMDKLPYVFPKDAFINGLISINWFNFSEEFEEINADRRWTNGKYENNTRSFV